MSREGKENDTLSLSRGILGSWKLGRVPLCKLTSFTRSSAEWYSVAIAALFIFTLAGCERKEKIVDIDTPRGQIEVERSVETGDVDVQVTDKD